MKTVFMFALMHRYGFIIANSMLFLMLLSAGNIHRNVHKADERVNKSDLDLVTAAHCLFFKMKCSHDEAFCGGNSAERGTQLIKHE